MRKILRNIIIVLLALCVFPLGLFLYEKSLPEIYGETYYAELSEMWTKLQTTEGPKLVIIGGSNVAFGINVEQLEEEVEGYTVCPMGLYAAIGVEPMLSLTKPYLNEGDIVILAIEPTSEYFSTYFGANAYWKCAESNPKMLRTLNWDQKGALVGNYYKYLQERLLIVDGGEYPEAEGVYRKDSFDEKCNMTFLREGNAMALGYDSATPVDFASVVIEDALAEDLNVFTEEAKKQGAEVYLSFCPVNREGLTNGEDGIEDFYRQLEEKLDASIISNPENYIYDSCWFYDNNVHLNTYGAMLRTHQLANDLNAERGIYKENDFIYPERPKSIYQATDENDDATEEDCFVWKNDGAGIIIAGLTEEGKTRKKITIPSQHEGRVVVGFAADAFAGNDILEELTIPETVEKITDGSFAGAEKLRRVVLLHTSTTPEVGDGLLEGNEKVKIYVPGESYSLYRDGAGCADNKWVNYLDRIERF